MTTRIPGLVWNAFAVFFSAWAGVAGWLLFGGDTSPVVRLALAVCAAASVYAGSVGLRRGARHRRLPRVSTGWCILLCALGLVAAILVPVCRQAHLYAAYSSIVSALKQEGLGLLMYASDNNGQLPPDTGRRGIYHSIAAVYPFPKGSNIPSGRPLVWCNGLSGLRLADIPSPDKVVAAYTSHTVYGRYAVLFLDGHVKSYPTRAALNQLLRERPALLAHAQRAKAKRDAARPGAVH